MKYLLPILALMASPLAAENHAQNFQMQMIDRASQAGPAGHAVACAGLFRALSLVSDGNAATAEAFTDKEIDAAMIAMMFHQSQFDDSNEATIDLIRGHINAVSAINLDWFTANLQTEGGPLNAQLQDNFTECDAKLSEWLAIVNGE